jgi:pimeloyl-ACP methyl ester carboxylesterase
VREFPVFVPWRGEHLAAVVAVPERGPRGLAVFSSVPGSPRTHRHQVWARAAERLGDRGIASVRFEFVGLDDSTGSSVEVSMAVSPLDQILAVTRFAQRAVGADPVVAAGNCLGAQAALALAAELPECTGAVCMLPPAVRSGAVWGVIERAQGGRIQVRLRSNRLLRRLVVRPLERFDLKVRPAVGEPLLRALEHARVLFLYDQSNLASRSRAFPKVRALVGKLPEPHRSRFELRVLPSRGLQQFATIDVQETSLEALVEWVDVCLPAEQVSMQALGTVPAGER